MLGLPAEDADGAAPAWGLSEPPRTSTANQGASNHAALCRAAVETGAGVLREVFDTIHPPISLQSRLAKIQAFKTLQRLQHRGVVNPAQWAALYPKDNHPQSGDFDNVLLQILLRNVCHLSPPYPNGWDGTPLMSDTSLSANLVRLDRLRGGILIRDAVSNPDLEQVLEQLSEVLRGIGGSNTRRRVDAAAAQGVAMNQTERNHYVERLSEWHRGVELMNAGIASSWDQTDLAPPPPLTSTLTLPQIQTPEVAQDEDRLTASYSEEPPVTPSKDLGSSLQIPTGREAGGSVSNSRRNSATRTPDFLAQDRLILQEHHKMLVDAVRSDAVLAKLVKAGVLTHEEKNGINIATRNVDRMRALLKLLPTKQRAAFGAFCEALKYKYTTVYDTIMRAKKIAMERPDDVTEASANLRSSYKSVMSRLAPVPWHPKATVDIRDFYTPLYITDQFGREWTPDSIMDLLSRPKRRGHGRRVLVEGESGSGKSTVCRYVTTAWAHRPPGLADTVRLVYYIQVKLLKKNLAETILEHNYEAGYNKTPAEVYGLITAAQGDVLFILDGLEDLAPKVASEVMDLLHGRLFPGSCVLVTVNSTYLTPALIKTCHHRLVSLGLAPHTQEEFVLRYARLTGTSEEQYYDLLDKVSSCDSLQVLVQNPQLCLCVCLLSETDSPVVATTTTTLLTAFFIALQKLYCKRKKIRTVHGVLPESLQILAQDIEEMAWRCMHQNGSFYMYDQSEDPVNPMYALGILQRRASSALPSLHQLYFTNRMFQDFMVARVLCRLDPEDFREYVDSLVRDTYYSNVTKYFCGLLKEDYETDRLQSVISGLGKTNLHLWRGYTPMSTPRSRTGLRTPGSTTDSMGRLHTPGGERGRLHTPAVNEGRLGDFVLSLECLYECEGRGDMRKIIADSLPGRMFTKHKKLITHSAILGLDHILRLDSSLVVELELRLDHFTRYYTKTLSILGRAINHSTSLCDLLLRWSDPVLLSEVLASVFAEDGYVTTVNCFDETKRWTEHKVPASVWANMKRASRHMGSVRDFIFADCENKAMVSCILHSLPYTIHTLSITHTTLDIVSAQALARRIEAGQSLQTLDMTGVKLCRPDFSHICSGLRLSGTLQQLILADTNLDVTSFIALAEALKFNRSLRELDVSGTQLSDTACDALSTALADNRVIAEVIMDDARLTRGGQKLLIEKSENRGPVLAGIETVRFVPLQTTFTTSLGQFSLPAIKSAME